MTKSLHQNEVDKFEDLGVGESAVRVLGLNGLVTDSYDYIAVTYPSTTSEVYTYKTGGSGGTKVATVTIVYTTTSKCLISSVTKA